MECSNSISSWILLLRPDCSSSLVVLLFGCSSELIVRVWSAGDGSSSLSAINCSHFLLFINGWWNIFRHISPILSQGVWMIFQNLSSGNIICGYKQNGDILSPAGKWQLQMREWTLGIRSARLTARTVSAGEHRTVNEHLSSTTCGCISGQNKTCQTTVSPQYNNIWKNYNLKRLNI